jgi:probable HAF family extracellular repeat protein
MSMQYLHKAVLPLALLAAPVAAQAGIHYTLTPIGPLGSSPTGINNKGQVVGTFTSGAATHAFLYSGKGYVDLGTLGGGFSRAGGINDAGVVVGASANAAGDTRAFIYANGSMTDIGTLGGSNSSAAAINNNGQVVGVADSAGGSYAFLYTPGAGMRSLGALPGGESSRAEGINDAGAVVGGSAAGAYPLPPFHAFRYAIGSMTDLDLPNGSWSIAQAINENGDAVGWSNAGLNIDHAFLYAGGAMTDLGTLAGIGSSAAYDINNAGQVVGWSEVADKASRPFLYTDGTMVDLNRLVDPASDWTIEAAYAINDLHQIAAYGCKGNACQALLLDPVPAVPEPQTYLALLTGLGLFGWILRRRRNAAAAN